MQILVNYHWPGNVRELQNIVERACALAKGSVLGPSDIHLDIRPAKAANGPGGFLPDGLTLEQWEDEMVQEALRRAKISLIHQDNLLWHHPHFWAPFVLWLR